MKQVQREKVLITVYISTAKSSIIRSSINFSVYKQENIGHKSVYNAVQDDFTTFHNQKVLRAYWELGISAT